MEGALYDPEHGYYATRDDRTTRDGDYLTAPELHPIFGATLAAQVEEVWERLGRPGDFTLREEAAGSGALGIAILDRLVAVRSPAIEAVRYLPIEANPARDASVRARCRSGRAWCAPRTCRAGRLVDRRRSGQRAAGRAPGPPPDRCEAGTCTSCTSTGATAGSPSWPCRRRRRLWPRAWCVSGWSWSRARWPRSGWPRLGGWGRSEAASTAGWRWSSTTGTRPLELYDPELRPAGLLRSYRRHHASDDPYRFVGRTGPDGPCRLDLAGARCRGRRAGRTRTDDPGRGAHRVGPRGSAGRAPVAAGHDGRGLCRRTRRRGPARWIRGRWVASGC